MPLPKRALALLLCALALLAVFAAALPIILNSTLAAPSSWIHVTDAMVAPGTRFTVTFTSTTTYDITGLLSGNATGLSIADDGILLDTLTGSGTTGKGILINGAGFEAPVPLTLEVKDCNLANWGTSFPSIVELLNHRRRPVRLRRQHHLQRRHRLGPLLPGLRHRERRRLSRFWVPQHARRHHNRRRLHCRLRRYHSLHPDVSAV